MADALLLFLFSSLAACLLYIAWYYLVFVPRYPRGPRPLPLVGNLLQLPSTDLHAYMAQLKDEFGSVYTLFLPRPNVVLASYDTVREALVTKGDAFSTKEQSPVFQLFTVIPNGGVMLANGEMWREQRRMALHILRQFGMGKSLMEARIMNCVEELVDNLDSIEDKDRVDMFPPIQLCIGNVINNVLFGRIFHHQDADRLHHFVDIIARFLIDLISRDTVFYQAWPWLIHLPLVNRTYKRMQREYQHSYLSFIRAEVDAQFRDFDPRAPVNTFVQAYIAEMVEEGERSEINGGEEEKPQKHLSIEQLYNVVSDFWLAGMETTSTTLRWAILYLMNYPEIQAKARAEIEEVVGCDRYVTMADKPSMPYVNALICEIQRLPGVVGMNFRITDSPQSINGHHIPADTAYLLLLVSTMNEAPFDDPLVFRPERWLEPLVGVGKLTVRRDLLPYLIPFGVGRRQCPGEALAKMELFLILATLLQKYEFHVVSGDEEVDLKPIYGEVLYPKRQLCRVVKRN